MQNNPENLYISKWWGEYVGGCDDSLLLLDYLEAKNSSELSLKRILNDLNLTVALKTKDWKNNTLSWSVDDRFRPDFDLVVSVVIDLSAIVLESLKSGNINLNLLDSMHQGVFVVETDLESLNLLVSGLSFFIDSKDPFCDFGDVMGLNEIEDIIRQCREIREDLKRYL